MKRCAILTPQQIEELQNFIKTTNSAHESRRAQTVLLLDQKNPYKHISFLTGFKRRQIFKYRAEYLKQGLRALEHKHKGKPKPLLSRLQRNEVIEILTKTSPKDYEYESDFWTTSILGHLIKTKYNVSYKSKKPFYLLFEEAKFSFHKPGKVYEKRDETKVQIWKEETRPILEKAFKYPETVILCEDEMILSSQTTFQKIWLKKGEYPKIEVSNTKKNKSIYGFLNIKTGKEHAFVKDWQNMYITVEVLKEIRILYPNYRILLFWDGAGWHRGSEVQKFIEEDGNIETVYFPSYSPEENPQEHVWKSGRCTVTHNRFIPDISKAADDFIGYLNTNFFKYDLLDFSALS